MLRCDCGCRAENGIIDGTTRGEYRGGLDMYQLQGFHARPAPLQKVR